MNSENDSVIRFYLDVQNEIAGLEKQYGSRLKCSDGCEACCVDEITVFDVEAENIRENYPDLLADGRPYQKGKCAFLDLSGSCRIYKHRPYVCRTQGLPLSWLETLSDGSMVDMRDICPLNDKEIQVECLKQEQCWTIGKWEARLIDLQLNLEKNNMARMPLRELFKRVQI